MQRPSRVRRGAIPAALCALALTLTACGSERAADKDPKAGTDDRVEAGSTATAPATILPTDSSDPESSDPGFLAFKDVLRGLGYIDLRIHGPQRSGESVEFTLDLRLLGGELCLSGKVTGTRTVTDPYGGSPEVACPDVQRLH